ncbi:unnamed protein product [Chilo suppressalis]|uniref:Protein-lysine N-methyltransferase SMYD4 n=1 Tax=Chilo suppressalis TaxID=168631 RepID=A0ABN8B598_CHISP|nr:unnamed protein product [Chilo suppressalis]
MSIDSLYEGAIAKLTAQNKIVPISLKLLTLKTNEDRVLYVYEILENLKAFPAIVDVAKNECVSAYYRNLGNKCFQNSDHYKAWQFYNLSLLHAPCNTESYALAISNRSAVLYSLKKYNESINDIEKVLSLNYPANLKEKLTKRKESCQKLSGGNVMKEVDDCSFLCLQDPQTPRFPSASSKLEVIFTEEMGRHVIAKSDIKVGEVLVQEEPYFKLLLKSQYLFACSYCLSRDSNLFPCSNCCFALYCSNECKDKAWSDYHMTECKLMATIIEMQFTKLEFLALRTVIKCRNDHTDWSALFKTVEDADNNSDTEYRGHMKIDDKWVYDSQYYSSIHTLASNIDKRSVSDIFQKSVTAAVFLYMLIEKTDFLNGDNKDETDKIKKLVGGLLLHHTMTSPTNMHGISTNTANIEGNFVDEFSIASAPYAFLSLINHSCAPNVVRFSKLGTGQMFLFALRPIKKGMQLFDNYGAHHAIEDLYTRIHHLKFQYKFTCHCEACINNWPQYLFTRPAKNLPRKLKIQKEKLLDGNAIDKLQKADRATAEKIFKPLCELAENLESYAPCTELADCQESLKQCLEIFFGVVPYGYSQLVDWKAVPPKC